MNGRDHLVDLGVDMNIILSALHDILKKWICDWSNTVRWQARKNTKKLTSSIPKWP
jgi:hypothetical protein